MSESKQVVHSPVSLQANLDQLKAAVQDNQKQIAQITKSMMESQQDIAALQAGIAEIEQTVKAYTQALQAAGDLGALGTFVAKESAMALAAVGPGKADLDKTIKTYDDKVAALTQAATDAQTASDKAAADLAQAQKKVTDSQASYDGAKAMVAKLQTWAADTKSLKGQTTTAADAGGFGTMYFLVQEMQAVLGKITGSDNPDDFRTELTSFFADLQTAKTTLRQKRTPPTPRPPALSWPRRPSATRRRRGGPPWSIS
jgi:phage shock protein A